MAESSPPSWLAHQLAATTRLSQDDWIAYDRIAGRVRRRPSKVLLLGADQEAASAWSLFFPYAQIYVLGPHSVTRAGRIFPVEGHSSDATTLDRALTAAAPGVFDFVLDSASHHVEPAYISFQRLFQHHLHSGGHYAFQSWGASFSGNCPKGQQPAPTLLRRSAPPSKLIPSHQHGLAGLAKALVDHLAARDIAASGGPPTSDFFPIKSIVFQPNVVAFERQ